MFSFIFSLAINTFEGKGFFFFKGHEAHERCSNFPETL